jgi:hypothetical protein
MDDVIGRLLCSGIRASIFMVYIYKEVKAETETGGMAFNGIKFMPVFMKLRVK